MVAPMPGGYPVAQSGQPTGPRPMLIPPPEVFGFDSLKFPGYYPGQDTAILRVFDSKKRISVECLPTGSGKSLMGQMVGRLKGVRTATLTRRKGLQTQMLRDFEAQPGLHDVRGQGNYPCIYSPGTTVELGPCHAGMRCIYRDGGCTYYDAVALAKSPETKSIVTNYSFWFMQAKRGQKLGEIDFLVCDEAHGIMEELSNFLTIEISRAEIERLGVSWPIGNGASLESWKAWASVEAAPAVEAALAVVEEQGKAGATGPGQVREKKRLDSLKERLADLSTAAGRWVCSLSSRNGSLQAAPIWPAEYVEKYLFRGIPKILMMSATIRPKGLEFLGLYPGDYEFNEVQSTIPVQNRLIHCVDAPRMNHRISDGEMGIWLDKIDMLLKSRLDRRIIIHTGSYDRRNYIMTNSEHRAYMHGHSTQDLDEVIERFRTTPAPNILVSQSITEGFDFPYEDCELQLMVKIPYPDGRDPLVVARQKDDKDYTSYVAMQTMVQTAGRNVRAPDDFGENFVVDGNTKWFMRQNAKFAPMWFNAAVRHVNMAPTPPPKMYRPGAIARVR